jgi:hypothetical protein
MSPKDDQRMTQRIRVAHSPDSDDAFMFYALAEGKLDTGTLEYVHELSDIESLNRRAMNAELEVSAVSIHAYAYIWKDYALLNSGSSMGDGYGPRLVARGPRPPDAREALRGKRIGVPGLLTTAYLALRLFQPEFEAVVLPFDRIEDACFEDSIRCITGPSGAYADRQIEGLYQASLSYDRRARRWLIAGEAALLGAAALFVLEFTRKTHKPDNIPFEPEIRSLRDATGVGLRVAW